MIRMLRVEFLKTKRTPFFLIHLLVPIIISVLILAYYSYAPWDFNGKVSVYFQVLSCGFPIIIGLVCAMVAEQEASAGHFQEMLTATKMKVLAFISKLLLLLLFGFGATLFSTAIFSLGFIEMLHEGQLGYKFYVLGASILFGSHVLLYIIHFIVSMRFGRGASIGLGIVGALLTALLITGLGEGIWMYIPYGWGGNLIQLWITKASGMEFSLVETGLQIGIIVCISGTLLILIAACIWFWFWEGRKSVH